MPKKYEKMRDEFKKEGLTVKDAKKKAAMIYISQAKNKSKAAKALHH